MTQIKLRFSEASTNQQQQLLALFLDSFSAKDTLLYSTNPELEAFFSKQNASGSLSYPESQLEAFVYLLESNVGINKSNKNVERQVAIDLDDYQTTISIAFNNNNPVAPPSGSNDDNLNYANYQRILVSPAWQLHSITIDGIKLEQEKVDDNLITTKSGDQFRQIGFLTKVDAQTSSNIQIRFSKLAQNMQATTQTIFLQKQPGQKPTPYTITWRDAVQTVILDRDLSTTLQTEVSR
jgi:hypothetical protein